jgi:putative ABC transport system permease protein
MIPFLRKLPWLMRRRQKAAELREELAFHLAEEKEERRDLGLADDDAHFAARRDLGSLASITEDTRAVWGWPLVEEFVQDLRYATRTLLRNPGFTAAAIAPIALTIGVNTGIFSILDAVAFRALPVPQPNQLISVSQRVRGVQRYIDGSPSMLSMPEFQTYRDSARTFSGVMGYSHSWKVTLGGEAPQEVEGQLVTCNYFEVLQVKPTIGSGFTPSNCEATGPASVVLSHDLWSRVFSADPDILSKSVTLNRQPFAVVGVAPEDFLRRGTRESRVLRTGIDTHDASLRPEKSSRSRRQLVDRHRTPEK